MSVQLSVSEIVDSAAQLSPKELEVLLRQLNRLRANSVMPALSKGETALLMKINEGFPEDKWSRLSELDEKMEVSTLTDAEAAEALALAEELETYTVQRFQYIKKLASLRNVSVEILMEDLGIKPR